jgi:hypothetical protein
MPLDDGVDYCNVSAGHTPRWSPHASLQSLFGQVSTAADPLRTANVRRGGQRRKEQQVFRAAWSLEFMHTQAYFRGVASKASLTLTRSRADAGLSSKSAT